MIHKTRYRRLWLGAVAAAAALLVVSGFESRAGETAKKSEQRSKASSRSTVGGPATADAGKATAVTRRETGDGTRIIQVIEDDKMIRIAERPASGITVIVVETVRDSEKVSRYSARTPQSLKKKHPRGYELYEKYAQADPFVDELADESGDRQTEEQKRLAMQKRQREQLQKFQQEFLRRQQSGFRAGAQTGFRHSSGFQYRGASSSSRARASGSASGSGSATGRSSASGSSGSGGRTGGSRRARK